MTTRLILLLTLVAALGLAAPNKAYGTQTGIAILMMHRFSATSTSPYSLTPTAFTKILEYLRDNNVCIVDLLEYSQGTFVKRCAGRKVAALSFDDGHPSQFRFNTNSLDPTSGIGILQNVLPNAKATFFLNVTNGGAPFGTDSKRKIAWLRQNNFIIGNHTVSHPLLSKISPQQVAQEINGVCDYFAVSSMILAYPYGLMPLQPLASYKLTCQIPAAFRAWLGYFEGQGQNLESGALLAPLPKTADFAKRRLSYPRLNISSYNDFLRDVAQNPNWLELPKQK